jgi:hypothetical protein
MPCRVVDVFVKGLKEDYNAEFDQMLNETSTFPLDYVGDEAQFEIYDYDVKEFVESAVSCGYNVRAMSPRDEIVQ